MSPPSSPTATKNSEKNESQKSAHDGRSFFMSFSERDVSQNASLMRTPIRSSSSCTDGADLHYGPNRSGAFDAGRIFGAGVSLMYDRSRHRSTSSMVCGFLFVPPQKESRQRKEPPPRSLRPKILGPLPTKTKLARCARSDSRFRFTASTPKPSPSGRPPFQRAGVLNQRSSLCRALAMRIPSDFVFLIKLRAHIMA